MLWFAFLIGLHWLGYTSDKLSEAQVLAILEILKLGFFGYIVGRSGEKIMKEYSGRKMHRDSD